MPDNITILFLLKRVDCNDGVSSYCETLLTGLKANGDRVVIVSGPVTSSEKTQRRRQALESAALEWIILDHLRPNRPSGKTVKIILDTIRKYSVDVMSPQGLSLLPLSFMASKLSGKPVIMNYHPSIHGSDTAGMAKRKSFKERTFYRITATLFTPWKFIALSKDIIRFFREDCWISPHRIEYIVAGIDSDRYRPPSVVERKAARDLFQLSDTTLVCVLTGRLDLNKGHDLVIEAVRQLRVSDPELEIVCLFPGTGSYAATVEAHAKKDAADTASFRFLGFVDDDTLLKVYWASDIALLPSRLEGFGLAIAEGMACGAVPIRTPSGGSEEQIIDGETGFLVPFDDAKALAARIHDLADKDRRQRMRGTAIAHAQNHFGRQTMIAKTSALYHLAKSAAH